MKRIFKRLCMDFLSGEGQKLGQFWANLNVGNATLQKSSTNTSITDGNRPNDKRRIKRRTYDLKCSVQERMIQVSIPADVAVKDYPYNAEVELAYQSRS